MLARSQAVGAEVGAIAVPGSGNRVVEGDRVVPPFGGLHKVLSLERIALNETEPFVFCFLLPVFECLGLDLIIGQVCFVGFHFRRGGQGFEMAVAEYGGPQS